MCRGTRSVFIPCLLKTAAVFVESSSSPHIYTQRQIIRLDELSAITDPSD